MRAGCLPGRRKSEARNRALHDEESNDERTAERYGGDRSAFADAREENSADEGHKQSSDQKVVRARQSGDHIVQRTREHCHRDAEDERDATALGNRARSPSASGGRKPVRRPRSGLPRVHSRCSRAHNGNPAVARHRHAACGEHPLPDVLANDDVRRSRERTASGCARGRHDEPTAIVAVTLTMRSCPTMTAPMIEAPPSTIAASVPA
jgi:hypothetical protein